MTTLADLALRRMRSPVRKLVLTALLALACAAAGQASAERYSPAAQKVLAQARAASGGSGWNSLRGWHETGHAGGLAYEAWLDPIRYGMRVETREAAGLHVHGFNGGGDWQVYPSGRVTGVDDRATVARARTEAFLRVGAYFFLGRFDARGDYLGVRRDGGRAFDVVLVQPVAGEPRELWFDRRSHLLARTVDRTGPRPIVTEFSDYRRVGPVRAPFRVVRRDGAGAVEVRQVESLDFRTPDRALFSLPRPSGPRAQ